MVGLGRADEGAWADQGREGSGRRAVGSKAADGGQCGCGWAAVSCALACTCLGLEVAVHDAVTVAVGHPLEQLVHEGLGGGGGEGRRQGGRWWERRQGAGGPRPLGFRPPPPPPPTVFHPTTPSTPHLDDGGRQREAGPLASAVHPLFQVGRQELKHLQSARVGGVAPGGGRRGGSRGGHGAGGAAARRPPPRRRRRSALYPSARCPRPPHPPPPPPLCAPGTGRACCAPPRAPRTSAWGWGQALRGRWRLRN